MAALLREVRREIASKHLSLAAYLNRTITFRCQTEAIWEVVWTRYVEGNEVILDSCIIPMGKMTNPVPIIVEFLPPVLSQIVGEYLPTMLDVTAIIDQLSEDIYLLNCGRAVQL